MHRPYSRLRRVRNTISILDRNQAGGHWVYSRHYPRIFIAPKNAWNAETKRWSGAVPIPLLALSALTTSAYTSLGVSQELNPQPQLLKVLVYHSATSAGWKGVSIYHEENGDNVMCPIWALRRRFIHICTKGGTKKTFFSAYFDKGIKLNVTAKHISQALKVAAAALNYLAQKRYPNRLCGHALV